MRTYTPTWALFLGGYRWLWLIVWPLLFATAWVGYVWLELPQATPAIRPSSIVGHDSTQLATLAPAHYQRPLTSSQLPALARAAIIAAEAPGYDPQGLRLVGSFSLRLARVLYDQTGTPRTLLRKVKELTAACVLEQQLGGDSLITVYVNMASFGGNVPGLAAGAYGYYSKQVHELQVHELALLAGLLKGPSLYNPIRSPQRAAQRRDEVLAQLARAGHISAPARDSLAQLPLGVLQRYKKQAVQGQAAYFIAQVQEQAEAWVAAYNDTHGTRLNLLTDGLVIHTTLDTRLQQHAEAAVAEHLRSLQLEFAADFAYFKPWRRDSSVYQRALLATGRYKAAQAAGFSEAAIAAQFRTPVAMKLLILRKNHRHPQATNPLANTTQKVLVDTILAPRDSLVYYLKQLTAGLLSVDTRTGAVRAWVGGLDQTYLPLDHIVQTRRQVGSAFKPIVYLAALQYGFKACDTLPNLPISIDTPEGKWTPRNAEGEYGPPLSLRCALAHSINVVTARIIHKIGVQPVAQAAQQLGIRSALKAVPSLAFGTSDISLHEMVQAYTTLANMGVPRAPYLISRITDRAGRVLYAHQPAPDTQAVAPALAYTVLDMLRDVVTYGTAGTIKRDFDLYNLGLDLAGKTGTTQAHSDGWFMSMTPELTTGVWVGCDNRRMRFHSMAVGRAAVTAMPLGGRYLHAVYSDKKIGIKPTKWQQPASLKKPIWCQPCPEMKKAKVDSLTAGERDLLFGDDDDLGLDEN